MSISDRLVRFAGTASLVVIATVLVEGRGNSRVVEPETAATSVTVANPASKPVPTTRTDDPALQPVELSIVTNIADGSNGSGFDLYSVPAGKRLVIQTVSVSRAGALAATNQVLQPFVQTLVGSNDGIIMLPIIPGGSALGSTLTGTLAYGDPGSAVFSGLERGGTSGAETDTVTMVGYLVNLP
jgi:hypothetical protein